MENCAEVQEFINNLLFDCGDKTVDFSFYTRRIMLGTVYLSAHAVFLQDTSPELQETRRFIERAIENLILI